MNSEDSRILLAPSDIAELAGVSRAAVSNWRKREGVSFPESVGGTASRPLFDKAEVAAWLTAQGKTVQLTSERALWEASNVLRGVLSVDEAADLITSLACLRFIAEENEGNIWTKLRSTSPLQGLDLRVSSQHFEPEDRDLVDFDYSKVRDHVRLRAVVEAVALPQREDLAAAVDYLIERATAAQLYRTAEAGSVNSPAARLLTALATGHAPLSGMVHDPACGIASVLTRVLESNPDVRGLGYEINTAVARRARQRARLAGLGRRLTILATDTLQADPFPDWTADVVVVEPPFGLRTRLSPFDPRWTFKLPTSVADLAWVFHAISHLSDDGRGYVLLPPSLQTSASARSLRAHLIEMGSLHSVVTLPARMVPYTSMVLSLWVVGPPHSAPDEIHFVDASGSGDPAKDVPRWLGVDATDASHARVPAAQVLATDSRLDPTTWIAWEPTNTSDELRAGISESLSELETSLDGLKQIRPGLTVPSLPTEVRVMTVRDLLKQGYLQVVSARFPRGQKGEMPVPHLIQGGDVARGKINDVPRVAVTDATTEAGDVLVSTIGGLKAGIDRAGGHVLGSDAHALRVHPDAPLVAEFLALALTGAWNSRFTKGTIPRVNYRDAEIPLPPVETQRSIVEFATRQAELRRLAREIDQTSKAITSQLLDAVRQAG